MIHMIPNNIVKPPITDRNITVKFVVKNSITDTSTIPIMKHTTAKIIEKN